MIVGLIFILLLAVIDFLALVYIGKNLKNGASNKATTAPKHIFEQVEGDTDNE